MNKIAVIYYPDAERKTSSQEFGCLSDRVFSYQINRAKKKGDLAGIELGMVALKKGTNLIPKDTWEAITASAANKTALEQLLKTRAIVVHIPDEEKSGRDTTDYSDFDAIREIVENCNDKEWLEFCVRIDRRSGEDGENDVIRLIAQRLKELDDIQKLRSAPLMGAFS